MSSIHTLLQIGNCFFVTLLREAEAYIEDSEWTKAYLCLEQYGWHMAKHQEVEAEILYPKLLQNDPKLEPETTHLIHDYDEIAKQSRLATKSIYDKDQESALSCLGRLIQITSGHWLSQVQTLYAAADAIDEQLLAQVADKLSEAVNMPTVNSSSLPH